MIQFQISSSNFYVTRRQRPETGSRKVAGFTLMEILIVLAILAVIIGLVLPNLIGAQKGANLKAAKVAIRSVEQAVEMYAADHEGEFPAGGQGLDVLLKSGRFGPYVKYGDRKFASLKKEDDPYTITLERAAEIVAEKKKADA